ncbi:MAG: hypothetical protein IH946_06870 [Bacteroidetes bacterium]|nr:hypothetical protein [Bacteroidota bacterium]
MKTTITSVLIFLALSVYAHVENESVVTAVDHPEDKKGSVELVYESYNFLLTSLEEERDAKLWNDETFNKKKRQIPMGGILKFKIFNKVAKLATPARFKLVVKDESGKTIHAAMMPGKDPVKSSGMYNTEKFIRLKESKVKGKIKVSASNTLSKMRYDWEIEVK